MPPWLSGVLGAVSGGLGGFFGAKGGGNDTSKPDNPTPASKPIWPWIAGGAGLFLLLVIVLLTLGGKPKGA